MPARQATGLPGGRPPPHQPRRAVALVVRARPEGLRQANLKPNLKERDVAKDRTRRFEVTVEIPAGVTVREMEGYIREAVQCWVGHMDPEEPIWAIDKDKVRVKRVKEPSP